MGNTPWEMIVFFSYIIFIGFTFFYRGNIPRILLTIVAFVLGVYTQRILPDGYEMGVYSGDPKVKFILTYMVPLLLSIIPYVMPRPDECAGCCGTESVTNNVKKDEM